MDEALDLQQENAQLKALLLAQREQLLRQGKQLTQLQQQVQALDELLRQFRRQQFAARSEKLPAGQLSLELFNEAEVDSTDAIEDAETASTDVPAPTRRRRPRISIPENYPRETILYTLPSDEQHCPHDGTPLKAIGTEDHEQLEIVPARVRVIRHARQKYTCPCCGQYHVTASKPQQPIEKSIASPGLLAHIATQKYCDALPLYRQTAIFKRAGIALERTNLANWMIRCGQLIQPMINLLQDHLLAQPVLHLDETGVQVLKEPDKTAQSGSYMWVMGHFTEQPAVVFRYAPGRGKTIPLELLTPDVGVIMVDGYSGYDAACTDYAIIRLGCWAHARRYLVTAKKLQKVGKAGKADQGLAYIQKLYALERTLKDTPPDERYQQRQAVAIPIIEKLRQWLEKSLPQVLPNSAIGKALTYLKNQWARLIRYVDDGRYPIDNNPAENAIRPFTIGRKNWLFANSQAGAHASANLYSLVETAKANGLNPYAYLRHLFTELPNAEGIEAFEQLLPWNVSKEHLLF